MNILIKQATIISEQSLLHNKVVVILIEGGIITQINKLISPKVNVKVINKNDLFVSVGWLDMQTVSGDPGLEHKAGVTKGGTFVLVYVEGLCILAILHSCEESDIPILVQEMMRCDAMRCAI